jgi:ribosomal protein S18 acetylase RimI-like enzyme
LSIDYPRSNLDAATDTTEPCLGGLWYRDRHAYVKNWRRRAVVTVLREQVTSNPDSKQTRESHRNRSYESVQVAEVAARDSLRIRGVRPEDLEGILALGRRTGVFTSEEIGVVKELVEMELDRPGQRDYHSLVAEVDGRIVGFACYGPVPMTDRAYDLYWIFVHPSYQGRAIGSALLAEVEKAVIKARGRMLLVDTSSTRRYLPARRFYKNHGFRKAAEVKDYYREGDARLTYVKQFPAAERGR